MFLTGLIPFKISNIGFFVLWVSGNSSKVKEIFRNDCTLGPKTRNGRPASRFFADGVTGAVREPVTIANMYNVSRYLLKPFPDIDVTKYYYTVYL